MPATKGVIEANESGYVKIQLKVSPFAQTDATFGAALKSRKTKMHHNYNLLKRCLFHHTEIDKDLVIIKSFELNLVVVIKSFELLIKNCSRALSSKSR